MINYKQNSRLASILSAIGALIIVISFIVFVNENNRKSDIISSTTVELRNKDSINQKLRDSLQRVNIIECIAKPLNYKDPDGDSMYYFKLRITDSVLVSKLSSVDYFFNDDNFNPQHKVSSDSLNNFLKTYSGSGTVDTLQVFLKYKNDSKIDTIFYLLSDNVKIEIKKNIKPVISKRFHN